MGRSGKLTAVNDSYIAEFINDDHYQIQKTGVILSCRTKGGFIRSEFLPMKQTLNNHGELIIGYKKKTLIVARIMYAAFNGELESDLVVFHKDGNRQNNRPENLIQDTQSRSMKHKYRELKREHPRGYKKVTDKITQEIVEAVTMNKERVNDLVKKFGLNRKTIYKILKLNVIPTPLGSS